jgi:histidine ammonia-lyase
MTAAAGLDQRAPLTPSRGVAARSLGVVRGKVAPMTEDRPLYSDIEAVNAMMGSGALIAGVEACVGELL